MATVVADVGSCHLRMGYSGIPSSLITGHNAIVKSKTARRLYAGPELEALDGVTSGMFFKRPCERGYVVDLATQKKIWEATFANVFSNFEKTKSSSSDPVVSSLSTHTAKTPTTLICTHPPLWPSMIAEMFVDLVFDELGYERVVCMLPTTYALLHHMQNNPNSAILNKRCCLVVDVGHSSSHAVPYYREQPLMYAIRR